VHTFYLNRKSLGSCYLNIPAPSLKDGAITTDQETKKHLILKESEPRGRMKTVSQQLII
jgi:hypothetical protein